MLEKKTKPHSIQIVPETGYSFDDYRTIIRLEKERMQRLLDTHSYIAEGEKFLVEATQSPTYEFVEPVQLKQASVNLYQRYATNPAFYGVPQRPHQLAPKFEREPAYDLVPLAPGRPEDAALTDLLGSAQKIICVSAKFWANYHFLLHKSADLSDNSFYGWEEQIPQVSVELGTSCFRHSPFTFQSWLLYRAPCEEQCLIIVDRQQFDWIRSHTADQLPQDTKFLILAEEGTAAVECANPADFASSFGDTYFLSDIAHIAGPENSSHDDKLPTISVVVCSYNQGEFLGKCLDSILDQDYPKLELIVVDGNSTDNSIDVLQGYHERCAHLLIEDDNGQSDALNKGFALSSGDVMTWVCSDDGLEPGSLFKVGRTFAAHQGTDIVVGGCRRIDPNGTPISIHHNHLPYNREVPLSFGDMISFGPTWLRGFYFIQPELFWSRSVWDRSGGYIKNHMFFAMDYELFLRFALAGARTVHIPDCLAFALVHEAQKSAHLGRNLPTIIRMMHEFEDMFDKAPKT